MKLYVVGLGPGEEARMTYQAMAAIEESDVLVGYTVYLDLIADKTLGKRVIATPMTKEVERCRLALEEATAGNTVAVVCSGDPGVYGMAGLIYELSSGYDGVEIHVVPGVTAACAGAALLGAPLIHDFAVISLSDLLTPWELIEKRLAAAAAADLTICLYNPASKKRKDYLKRACEITMASKPPGTVCGIAKNIGREGEEGRVLTLQELSNTDVDMFSTVFIGNSNTKNMNGKMVTPRGYRDV